MQRQALLWKRAGIRIGFVPTMGYLHEGHMSLVKEARRRVGAKGVVVVSIYVNPTQFAPTEDLAKYPRDLPRDLALCRKAGTTAVFTPSDPQMYPGKSEGLYSTYVTEEGLSQGLEGASRPTHFRGVTTIVAKLFNVVLADVAVFGAKDYQQAAVVARMSADLNFHTKVIVAPTVREKDGLAMSSRNKYLSPEQRQQGLALFEAIQTAKRRVRELAKPVSATALRTELVNRIHERPEAKVDYVEFFHPTTLVPQANVTKGTHLALAVFVGRTRLIDNARL